MALEADLDTRCESEGVHVLIVSRGSPVASHPAEPSPGHSTELKRIASTRQALLCALEHCALEVMRTAQDEDVQHSTLR